MSFLSSLPYILFVLTLLVGTYWLVCSPSKTCLLLYPTATLMSETFVSPFKLASLIWFVGVMLIVLRKRGRLHWSPQTTCLIIAQAAALVSFAVNRHNPGETTAVQASRMMLALSPILLAVSIADQRALRRFMWVASVSSIVAVGITILTTATDLGLDSGLFLLGGRTFDSVSCMAVIIVPVAAHFAFTADRVLHRAAWLFGIGILVAGIALTYRRMAILLLCAQAVWLILKMRRLVTKCIVVLVVLVFASGYVVLNRRIASNNIEMSLQGLADSVPFLGQNSDEARTTIRSEYVYPAALEIIRGNFLWGVGVGSFDYYARQVDPRINQLGYLNNNPVYPHNIVLEVLVHQGVIVAALMLSAVVLSLRDLRRAAMSEQRSHTVTLYQALYVSGMVLIAQSIVRDAFNDKFIYFLIAYGLVAKWSVLEHSVLLTERQHPLQPWPMHRARTGWLPAPAAARHWTRLH